MNLEALIQSTTNKIVAGGLVSTSFIFKGTCLKLILPRAEPSFSNNSKKKRCKNYVQSFCCTDKETKRTILNAQALVKREHKMCFMALLQQREALAAEEVSFPSLRVEALPVPWHHHSSWPGIMFSSLNKEQNMEDCYLYLFFSIRSIKCSHSFWGLLPPVQEIRMWSKICPRLVTDIDSYS